MVKLFRAAVLLALSLAAGAADLDPRDIYPEPLHPEGNPPSAAKTALGEKLFHETRLSVTGKFSCASCHKPDLHFTDGLPQAVGATGERHSLNTPTLYNVAFNASYGWDDTGLTGLEEQHRVPLFNDNPVEMGFTEDLLDTLADDADYPGMFAAAFPGGRVTTGNVIKAIATYVRTLRAPVSAFDRFLFLDDAAAMSNTAQEGMNLFFSARLGCSTCHASLNFSGPVKHTITAAAPVFHVTGVNGSTRAFRAPTLRQVTHTGPYMHNGSLPDLEAVLVHYQTTTAERVRKFSLTQKESAALIEFLKSL